MKVRLIKKCITAIYDAATNGDFKQAYSHLSRINPNQQRKNLNIFGFGSQSYKNNPLETEAYAFGDEIEKIFNLSIG